MDRPDHFPIDRNGGFGAISGIPKSEFMLWPCLYWMSSVFILCGNVPEFVQGYLHLPQSGKSNLWTPPMSCRRLKARKRQDQKWPWFFCPLHIVGPAYGQKVSLSAIYPLLTWIFQRFWYHELNAARRFRVDKWVNRSCLGRSFPLLPKRFSS